MVAEQVAMASSSTSQTTIGHEGVANVAINQESVNQLMEGAQAIEAASSGVNEGTGWENRGLRFKGGRAPRTILVPHIFLGFHLRFLDSAPPSPQAEKKMKSQELHSLTKTTSYQRNSKK